MKIAFFTYTRLEYAGGIAKFFIQTSSGLKKRYKDLDIDIVTFDEKTLKFILYLYFIYFTGRQDLDKKDKESYSEIYEKLGGVGYHKISIFKLKKKLQEYDVIYATNNLLEVFLFRYLIGFRNLPPVIYGFHNPVKYEITSTLQSRVHNYLYNSVLYKFALEGGYKFHAINDFSYSFIKKYFPNKFVAKIYNPFDFRTFTRLGKTNLYKHLWNKNKLNIIWTGRLTKEKGISDLLDIINSINELKISNKIYWNIFGEGEERSSVIKLVSKWDNVIYHGYKKGQYMPSILKNNDILITTSRAEGFPTSLLEAQCFGLPVIGYDIYGVNDIIDNGINGILVCSKGKFINVLIKKVMQGKKYIKKDKIRKYIRRKFNSNDAYKQFYSLLIKK